jgi:ABC-type nitrate/sulfonate/bicarbonate transport system substrate-binding protein
MNKRIVAVTFALITGALGAAGYIIFRQTGSEMRIDPPGKIIFGVDFSVISGPVWIAENRGYFEEEGLDVKITDYPSGRTALAEMVEKENLDMVTVAQTPVMYNGFSRSNYSIVVGMACSWDDVLLLVRRDQGVTTGADLKGKRIGTPVGSSGHFFLDLLLFYSGLRMSDVRVIDIDAPDLPNALSEGRVDAIAVWQPHINNARKLLGENALLLPSKNIYREDFYIVARNDFIRDNLEALKRFLKALDRAENFIQQNRKEAVDIVAGRLKLDRGVVGSFWDGYEFKLFLDQTILIDLEAEARWAIENSHTTETRVPDYLDFIYTEALEAVKPEAVNIIR